MVACILTYKRFIYQFTAFGINDTTLPSQYCSAVFVVQQQDATHTSNQRIAHERVLAMTAA
jgi:hypothetical protein